MKKVYAVIENWDNGESYEDRCDTSSVIAICISKRLAGIEIHKAKRAYMAKAEKSGKNYTVRNLSECEGWRKDIDGLYFESRMCSNIFNTYSCGTDIFWWEVSEFELIES